MSGPHEPTLPPTRAPGVVWNLDDGPPWASCTCGHAEGYHDARSLETDDQIEVCAVWACYCAVYDKAPHSEE